MSTIKFHINMPLDTDLYKLETVILLCEKALVAAGYHLQYVKGWKATLGMPGWRIDVMFNLPPTPSQMGIVAALTVQTSYENWSLEGPITAWVHP